ncbi:MAG: histone deacetylase family protein [Qingshengfaniella sp.]
MSTLLISHDDGLNHVTPPGHPEQVARLTAVMAALSDPGFDALIRQPAHEASDADLLRCHPQRYLDKVQAAVPAEGWHALDGDTHVMSGSVRAAKLAVGAAIQGVDAVLDGAARNAFCATRPPGHHAERETAMGFCIYGTIAIAAKYALDVRGLSRVAVIDFDVHHGNGTQDLLWDEERAFFASTHQMPLYPGSGAPGERGAHRQILNLPFRPGTDGAIYCPAFERTLLPAVDAFRPELILVSAGFDAHRDDPLAQMELTAQDFGWITDRICELADRHCGGKLVSTLEGGYDLQALGESAAEHVAALMQAADKD